MPARARERLSLQQGPDRACPDSATQSQQSPGALPPRPLSQGPPRGGWRTARGGGWRWVWEAKSGQRQVGAGGGKGRGWAGHPPAGEAAPEALDVGQGQVQLEEPRGHLEGQLGAQLLRQHPRLLGHLSGWWSQGLWAKRKPRRPPSQGASPHSPPHQTFQLPEGEGEEVDLDDAAEQTPHTCLPHAQPGGIPEEPGQGPYLWKRLA